MHLIVLLCIISASTSFAQQTLSGNIGGMTFEATSTPYIITDNITIEKGRKTIIKEGCVFLFRPFTGIIVNGSIIVEGSLKSPVVFSSINDKKYNPQSDLLPNPFDWNGILIASNSGSVTFSNIVLEYSVYGIKSQKEALILNNATFKSNGQFHFTVDEKIMPVAEELPFSYSQKPETDTHQKIVNHDIPQTVVKANNKYSTGKIVLRILSGTVFLGGLGAGLYYNSEINKYNKKKTTLDTEFTSAQGGMTETEYLNRSRNISDSANKDTKLRTVSYITAAIGAVGLTLTFVF
jgi:hypothetical protein